MTATPIPKRNIRFNILDQRQIKTIHQTSIRLMENMGMKVGGGKGD